MAALRLGIGDILTVCRGAIDLGRTFHDEPHPEDVRCIVADMKMVKAHLKYLESKVGDENLFVKERSDIAPVIKKSLEPLHKDLCDMTALLNEYKKQKPSLHIVDQCRYLVFYKAKLKGFQEKMPVHRKSISEIQELVSCESEKDRRASIVRLEDLVEELERVRKVVDDEPPLEHLTVDNSQPPGEDDSEMMWRDSFSLVKSDAKSQTAFPRPEI